jgi:hypothetical protein
MAKKRARSSKAPGRVGEAKVAMSYRLAPAKVARAQKILGTATATATIEEALDMIIFRRDLMDGLDRAFGLPIVEAFPDSKAKLRRRGQ